MDRLISEQAVLLAVDNLKSNFTCFDPGTLDEVASHVKAIQSAYRGMTNGEVIKMMFPNAKITEKSERFPDYPYVDVFFIDEYDMNCFPRDWWNSPYEPQESEVKE